jgi:hypothetical protein
MNQSFSGSTLSNQGVVKISVYVKGLMSSKQCGPGRVFVCAFETMQCDCPSLLHVEDARLAKINLTTGGPTESCHQVPNFGLV